MKKVILSICLVTTIIITSCNHKTSDDYIASQQEIDSLKQALGEKDNQVNLLFETLNEIEDNLAIVSSKFGSVENIKRIDNEMSQDAKAKIGNQINEINKILSINKRKVAELNTKLKSSKKELVKLNDFVAKLESRISQQDSQISAFLMDLEEKKIVIANLNKDVENLTLAGEEKDKIIEQHVAESNTAYYAIGSAKELTEKGILDKKGGFIGIGKKEAISTSISSSEFNKIDITKTRVISVGKRKIKLLSQHPDHSYELVMNDKKEIESIRIKNVKEFWKLSKYLVILTK